MKNLILIISIFALILTLPFYGCVKSNHNKTLVNNERIIEKESAIIDGYGCTIVEIDGNEYLITNTGGVCPLVKTTNHDTTGKD